MKVGLSISFGTAGNTYRRLDFTSWSLDTVPNPSSSTSRLRRPKSTTKFNPPSPYATPSATPMLPTSPLPPRSPRPPATPQSPQVPNVLQPSTPKLLSGTASHLPSRIGAVSVSPRTGLRQPKPILKSALRGMPSALQTGDSGSQTSGSVSELTNSGSERSVGEGSNTNSSMKFLSSEGGRTSVAVSLSFDGRLPSPNAHLTDNCFLLLFAATARASRLLTFFGHAHRHTYSQSISILSS